MRRAVSLALVALATTLAHPAGAAPYAGAEEGAAFVVDVTTTRGTFALDVLASTPKGGAPRLRVSLTPAAGSSSTRLYGELPGGALTVHGATTTLRTRLGGLPLAVTWQQVPYGVAAFLGRHDGDDSAQAGWTISGSMATPTITLAGVRCTGEPSGVQGTALAYDDAGYGAPLATGLGLPVKGLRCGSEPSSLPPVP